MPPSADLYTPEVSGSSLASPGKSDKKKIMPLVIDKILEKVAGRNAKHITKGQIWNYIQKNKLWFERELLDSMFDEADFKTDGHLLPEELFAAMNGRYKYRQHTDDWVRLACLILHMRSIFEPDNSGRRDKQMTDLKVRRRSSAVGTGAHAMHAVGSAVKSAPRGEWKRLLLQDEAMRELRDKPWLGSDEAPQLTTTWGIKTLEQVPAEEMIATSMQPRGNKPPLMGFAARAKWSAYHRALQSAPGLDGLDYGAHWGMEDEGGAPLPGCFEHPEIRPETPPAPVAAPGSGGITAAIPLGVPNADDPNAFESDYDGLIHTGSLRAYMEGMDTNRGGRAEAGAGAGAGAGAKAFTLVVAGAGGVRSGRTPPVHGGLGARRLDGGELMKPLNSRGSLAGPLTSHRAGMTGGRGVTGAGVVGTPPTMRTSSSLRLLRAAADPLLEGTLTSRQGKRNLRPLTGPSTPPGEVARGMTVRKGQGTGAGAGAARGGPVGYGTYRGGRALRSVGVGGGTAAPGPILGPLTERGMRPLQPEEPQLALGGGWDTRTLVTCERHAYQRWLALGRPLTVGGN